MWPFPPRKARRAPPASLRSACRPRLEALEDRCVPSAGALDPTFNPTGRPPGTALAAPTSVGSGETAVLVQPSGKIVTTGQSQYRQTNGYYAWTFSAACFNPNGSLDTTFGSGGTALITAFSTKNITFHAEAYAGALYPTGGSGDDKIIEAGQGTMIQGKNTVVSIGFALVRLNANGSVDTSFGNGGLVMTTFSQRTTGAKAVVVTPDGKIIAAGDNENGIELARYNANGSLDTTFGSGGTVYAPIAPLVPNDSIDGVTSLALDANGNLIVGGYALIDVPGTNGVYMGLLARFQANGTLDGSFGNGGMMTATQFFEVNDVVTYPAASTTNAGKFIVAGGSLSRYNADGSLDTSWGGTGTVTGNANAVAIQSDGKVVAAGGTNGPIQVARYNADGSLDSTFGTGGIVTTTLASTATVDNNMALQSNGDIVVGAGTNGKFLVARYLPSEPEIGSLTGSPNPVTSGSSVTLTASNITDGNPGSTITQVAFYVQLNATNTLLGYGTQASPGVWTFTWTVSLTPGSYTLLAQATDSDGVLGDPLALPLQVL
jgi:uncharacterized delta-60 repeat protein